MAEQRTRTIRTDALARVEGEGAMLVTIEGDRVADVKLKIYEPPRSVQAMEQACGIEVGGPLRALRRLLHCGEWIESHALHVFMLHLPDFLGY
jgi:sulfhydrogenase subunit alpha